MSPKLPPQAQLARWAIKYGPLVVPYVKRLAEQGRWRQLAIMHARTMEDGAFSWEMVAGDRVWVVWSGDEVIETYPERPDLEDVDGDPFPNARLDRRQDPGELPVRRFRERIASVSLPSRTDDPFLWEDPDAPDTGGEVDGADATGDATGSGDPPATSRRSDRGPTPPPTPPPSAA